MAVKIFLAEVYNSRRDIEDDIIRFSGQTADLKPNVRIEGTREQLKKLQLSGRRTVWGVKCVELDPGTPPAKTDKANRGKQFDYGINGKIIKNNE